MTVRSKWHCVGVLRRVGWQRDKGFVYEADFAAVTTGSKENEKFFDCTPSGSMKLATYKDDYFTPGVEYYIDITPAAEGG